MSPRLYLRKNTAPWDRALRLAIAALLVLGVPAWVHGRYWAALAGLVAGFQLVAALTGY